jgi:hypothetical protein
MIILNILILSYLVIFTFAYQNNEKQYSSQVKETLNRYSREANLGIGEIKDQRFDRKSASEKSISFFEESEKFE